MFVDPKLLEVGTTIYGNEKRDCKTNKARMIETYNSVKKQSRLLFSCWKAQQPNRFICHTCRT